MDDLLADFVAETREMLEASAGEIVAWEADPGDRARVDLLFDPQTAGGLLAAIAPERAGKVLADLLAAGYPAIRLGSLIEGNPRLSLGPSSL